MPPKWVKTLQINSLLIKRYKEKAASKRKIRPTSWKSLKSIHFEQTIEKEIAARNMADCTKGLKKENMQNYGETLRIAPFMEERPHSKFFLFSK